jgi:hypothetical protein
MYQVNKDLCDTALAGICQGFKHAFERPGAIVPGTSQPTPVSLGGHIPDRGAAL